MIDYFIEFFIATSVDIAADKASKRYHLMRILRAFGGLLLLAVIIALIYVTFKYS